MVWDIWELCEWQPCEVMPRMTLIVDLTIDLLAFIGTDVHFTVDPSITRRAFI